MKSETLFREIPSWTVVLEVIDMLRLPRQFPATFQKQDICLENSANIAGLLETFYRPCKAKQYLEFTDQNRWITVLRHILQPHGWVLLSKETTRDKKKTILYTVQRSDSTLDQEVQLTFD